MIAPSLIAKGSFILSAADGVMAIICAVNGDISFVLLAILAGLMWAQGVYFQEKSDQE